MGFQVPWRLLERPGALLSSEEPPRRRLALGTFRLALGFLLLHAPGKTRSGLIGAARCGSKVVVLFVVFFRSL